MTSHGDRVRRAAKVAGVSRGCIWNRIVKHRCTPEQARMTDRVARAVGGGQ